VGDLRNGREPRSATSERIEHFMNKFGSNVHAA
jgi:hypothetical protein